MARTAPARRCSGEDATPMRLVAPINDSIYVPQNTQWYRYGALFPLLYAVAGRDALSNRFEIEAGLEDGGYLPAQRAR